MTRPTPRQRLLGLSATLAILVLVVVTPLVLMAIGATPWNAEVEDLGTLLSGPDDGTLALVVIAAVAWLAWLIVAAAVLLEAVSQVRGLPTPSLPGLALPQRTAGHLVAVAALLFVAAPTVATFAAPPAPAATAVPYAPPATVMKPAPVLAEAAPVLAQTHTAAAEQPTTDYTVKRGDSLWRIADRLLGDGARYTEILQLNRAVLGGRPDFIVAGTVLKVPHETSPTGGDGQTKDYVVQSGDTLSEIADAELGDPLRYPELFEASNDTVQPDGGRLTDPDLIRPGWEVTIPADEKSQIGEPGESTPTSPVQPPAQPPSAYPSPVPPASNVPAPEPVSPNGGGGKEEDGTSVPSWLVPGLTGAGAVLAGVILLAVRAHHNTQLRYRRPGQTVAPPPSDLRPVEKTVFVSGVPLTARIEHLDRALRHLAAACEDEGRAMPSIVTVTLARDTARLRLADEAELPQPWTGEGRNWSAVLTETIPNHEVIPPYPLLVSVGQDDAGGLHLVNLEHVRVANLSGDPDLAAALARHIAAELALNPWSVLVDVTVIGLGGELAALDSMRLVHYPHGAEVVASIAQSLRSARDAGWGDPDPYRVLITTGEGTGDIADLLSSPVPRLGAAVVSLGAPVPGSMVIEVDHTGALRAPVLGLDLRAAGLTSAEASACAAIVDLTRDSESIRIAPFEQAADGWRALADQGGALREDLTIPRGDGPAGDGSLLPGTAEEYVQVAATTAEDIETLAPVVPKHSRVSIEHADPTLDEDVAAWFDPEGVSRPRLILLGPVNARAFGVLGSAIAKRRPYFVELLAFLALHPDGVTGNAVADTFSIAGSRARTDLSILRDWLGDNPRTGREHLPQATKSLAFRETGVRTYQVEDVLVDVDLFRRLRARGQARGADGIADLKTALRLVVDVPFSNLREKGWSWLLDDERLHETIGCAIVDTAHVLVIDALARGDLAYAREAAETACRAAPYDEICRLDLVKVTATEGHGERSDHMLAKDVFNRTDDYLPPVELPDRTDAVAETQGWGTLKRRPPA